MELKYTTEMIDKTIIRASKVAWGKDAYMKKRLKVLQDLRLKLENTNKPLTEPQINYLNSLMEVRETKRKTGQLNGTQTRSFVRGQMLSQNITLLNVGGICR
jgi:hypothetical protein